MSSLDRPLSGQSLHFDLDEELRKAGEPERMSEGKRGARTLVKDGPLRVTLVALGPDARMEEHDAPGPVTIQAVRGMVRVTMGETDHDLRPGQLLALGPEAPHSVWSPEGGVFLLTVVLPPSARGPSKN